MVGNGREKHKFFFFCAGKEKYKKKLSALKIDNNINKTPCQINK